MEMQSTFNPEIHLFGWKPDNSERAKNLKSSRNFCDVAPHLYNYWQGEEIGLWNATKQCNNGKHLPADRQTIGDCVSHGHARGEDYLYCLKQVAGMVPTPYVEGQTSAMSEDIYGGSREIGNDLSYEDGSVGLWACQFLEKSGYATRDGQPYNGNLAKQYGARGVPSDVKARGKGHHLTKWAKLQTPDDAANAMKAGCAITVCTGLGFTMTRNSDGICRRSGRWGHCMASIGFYIISGRRIWVLLQSWGQNTPDGQIPAGGEAPDNSFGIEESDFAHILQEDDSYALFANENFQPLPPLNWVM